METEPPRKLKRVVIKEELVALTGGFMEALILNQFLYWSERTKDFDKFIEEERTRDPENQTPLTHGWIYKSMEELTDELMIGTAASTTGRYLDKLVKIGYLDRRHNPRYKWDRTWQYRPNICKIQATLQELGYALDAYPLLQNASCKMKNGSPQNARALPKTSSETTSDHNAQTPRVVEEETPQVHEHHMADDTDNHYTCPVTGDRINARLLSRSAAVCPCGAGVRVYNEHGKILKRPPQWLRRVQRGGGLTAWLPAVRAFCDLAHIKYSSLRHKTLHEWAVKLRELAGERSVQDLVDAIQHLDSYLWDGDGQGLKSPYQDRFDRALTEYWMETAPSADGALSEEDIAAVRAAYAED